MSESNARERWRAVSGFEGVYAVSDQGAVRSLPRTILRRNGRPLTVPGGPLKPRIAGGDHRSVHLHDPQSDAETSVLVHRLVLEAFVGPCPDGMEGCHNNGIPHDNQLTNLRWDTRSGNQQDAVAHGAHRCGNMGKTHCPFDHPLVQPNLMPWGLARGSRVCRACARARAEGSRQRARGQSPDMTALRAYYYAAIKPGWEA